RPIRFAYRFRIRSDSGRSRRAMVQPWYLFRLVYSPTGLGNVAEALGGKRNVPLSCPERIQFLDTPFQPVHTFRTAFRFTRQNAQVLRLGSDRGLDHFAMDARQLGG